MSRRKKNPLRELSQQEREYLEKLSRSQTEESGIVARAKEIIAVAEGQNYQDAASAAGRRSGDDVSNLVVRFNECGLSALEIKHGGGPAIVYTELERKRILAEFQRVPDRERDGTATWSLMSLRKALREAEDGLLDVSGYTIWQVLKEAGYSWQKTRSWKESGKVKRKRKEGTVEVVDPDTEAKKN